MSSNVFDPADVQTLLRVGALLRQYETLLTVQVSLSREISDTLTRSIGPKLETIAERAYVTDSPQPPPPAGPAPITVQSLLSPVKQLKPSALNHYNLTTDKTVSKTTQQAFKGTPLWVIIDNIDQTNSIAISFDNQTTFKKILKNTALNLPPWTVPDNLSNFWYKSDDAASVSFQLLTGET